MNKSTNSYFLPHLQGFAESSFELMLHLVFPFRTNPVGQLIIFSASIGQDGLCLVGLLQPETSSTFTQKGTLANSSEVWDPGWLGR